jgi:predicted nucleotide-binding protein
MNLLYYHVYIEHGDPSKEGLREAYELDLSGGELTERIVNPYLNGETFICGGQPIDASSVRTIRIVATTESSDELIPRLKAMEYAVSKETGISGWVSDEYSVIEHGENVTRAFIVHPPRKEKETSEKEEKMEKLLSKKVFIVHGRDFEPVKDLKTMLTEFGLEPFILHEKPSKGKTLVEKLEYYSNVGYAFVILTPDDFSSSADDVKKIFAKATGKEMDKLMPEDVKTVFENEGAQATIVTIQLFDSIKLRARQNVIMEFGFFWGLLGRHRVCCLYKGEVELPSDMGGLVYVPFKKSVNEVRDKVISELREAGYEIKE